MKKIIVIGSGFAGISAASFMARAGWDVTVLEKHNMAGGRARKFEEAGFTFDMGPSWYWMPDVFEKYFNSFGKSVADYYDLKRLDPSYRVWWPAEQMDIPADYNKMKDLFESIEKGSGEKLESFLKEAAFKYDVGINKLVQKPGRSLTEFIDADLAKGLLKLDVFTSMKKHVGKFFRNPKLRQLMEFPVLFLGALPEKIPALYSLMNYADIKLGTWYPKGGMHEVVSGMQRLAEELGVKFEFNKEVHQLEIDNGKVKKVIVSNTGVANLFLEYEADVIIGAADYHFIESKLLPAQSRSYKEAYWETRVMAPSCLIYYVGINKKLKNIRHHNLFFDTDFQQHGKEIYETKEWPVDPLFYVSATSVTDDTVAPEGNENLFFLVPVAAGLKGDTEELRNEYFEKLLDRFEKQTGEQIKNFIVFKRSYSVSDFVHDYNAFKGNAYGLANTLTQTAILKPSLKSKKISNLYYTGQLTVPGPGVPPSLISGEVVAREILKEFNS
ncbi:MAG: phytoene desaturase [Rhizobacter sp.]|nr:phytoene desaturase [Ferruginibacter sp.]